MRARIRRSSPSTCSCPCSQRRSTRAGRAPAPARHSDAVSSVEVPGSNQGGAAAGLPAAVSRPEVIKAIPIRHWGRWLSAAIVVYLVVALVYSFIKSPNVDWPTVFNYLFKPLVLRALLVTIELTFVAMAVSYTHLRAHETRHD